MVVKIAICDDELKVIHRTKSMLEAYPYACQVDTFTCGEELLESQENYEVILLDIDMSGLSGIETAKKLRESDKRVKLIYVTNYSDYTTFAFSVHAFAYLLKPLKQEDLFKQLDEALEYLTEDAGDQVLELTTAQGLIRPSVKDVLYFEYLNRKIKVKTREGVYMLNGKMKDLEISLSDKGYFMPHKSFIVNLYAVKKIQGYDIELTSGDWVPLSQKKSVAFRKALNLYLSNQRGR